MKYFYILLMILIYIFAEICGLTNNGLIACIFAVLFGLTVGEIFW